MARDGWAEKSDARKGFESVYENWKREIEIWQAFTDLAPKKQGPAIFLTTRESPRGSFGN